MGGIGKTSLAVKLAHQVAGDFDCAIWRSLHNAQPDPHKMSDRVEAQAKQHV
jgi:predicted ATPase